MDNSRDDWASSIGDAIRGAKRSYDRGRLKPKHELAAEHHMNARGEVECTDVMCPICEKEGTRVTTTTILHKQKTKEERMKEREDQRILEEFKSNVAKNLVAIENRLNDAYDAQSDDIQVLSSKIDAMNKKLNETNRSDVNDFRDYFDNKLYDLGSRNHAEIVELQKQNHTLNMQIDNLK